MATDLAAAGIVGAVLTNLGTYFGLTLKWKRQSDRHLELLIDQMRSQLDFNAKRVESLEKELTQMQDRLLNAAEEVQELKIGQIADRAQIRVLEQELSHYKAAS